MFTQEGWEYHGQYFDFPLRNVLPKPVQNPHPPLWVACSQLETIEMAGRRGMGALGFQFLSADAANAWVHAYYNAFTKRQEKLTEYRTNPNLALVSYFMCAPTDEEARRRADGVTFFQFALRYYGAAHGRERAKPGTVNLWDEYNAWKRANPEAAARALSPAGWSAPRKPCGANCGGSRPPTSTRSSCSTRPARTSTRISAKAWSCSPAR